MEIGWRKFEAKPILSRETQDFETFGLRLQPQSGQKLDFTALLQHALV